MTGLKFAKTVLDPLAEGLRENHSLSELRVVSCSFAEDDGSFCRTMKLLGLDSLASALSVHDTVETVEFSHCGLSDANSLSIKKIVNGQAARRNEAQWMSGLRGDEKPVFHEKQGLISLVLAGNKFGDQFLSDLLPVLSFDRYIRVIAST